MRRAAPALPDDGVVHRTAVGAFPEQGGLALVGDADGGDPARGGAGRLEQLPHGAAHRVPDLLGVVLDPAGTGVVLGEIDGLLAVHSEVVPDQQGGAAGGSLVDGENEIVHDNLP